MHQPVVTLLLLMFLAAAGASWWWLERRGMLPHAGCAGWSPLWGLKPGAAACPGCAACLGSLARSTRRIGRLIMLVAAFAIAVSLAVVLGLSATWALG